MRVWTRRGGARRIPVDSRLVRDRLPRRARVEGRAGSRARSARTCAPPRPASPTTRPSARRASSAGRRRGSPKNFASDRFPNDQGECRELRPAPMFRRAFQVTKPVARARIYSSGLAYHALTLNGGVRLRPRARPRLHRLLARRCSTPTDDVTTAADAAARTCSPPSSAPASSTRRRAPGTGAGRTRVARDPAAAARPADHLPRRHRGDHRDRRVVAGEHRRPDALRQLLPGRDLRRAARDRRLGPAGVRRLERGRPRASWTARRASLRAQQHEPIRESGRPGPREAHGAVAGRHRVRRRTEPRRLGRDRASRRRRAPRSRSSTPRSSAADGQREHRRQQPRASASSRPTYYVAKGTGEERWRPRFTYKGFQYVQLSGPGGQPLPAGVTVDASAQ